MSAERGAECAGKGVVQEVLRDCSDEGKELCSGAGGGSRESGRGVGVARQPCKVLCGEKRGVWVREA